MTTSDLLVAIGEAEECYVEEAGDSDAEAYQSIMGKRHAMIKWIGIAATIFVMVGVAWLYANGGRIFRKNSDIQEESNVSYQKAVAEEHALEIDPPITSAEERSSDREETIAVEDAGENAFDKYKPANEEYQQEEYRQKEYIETVMISSFEGTVSDEETTITAAKISGDKAIENGNVWMSPSLSGAIACYGDHEEYRYRVFVELFQDDQQISNDGEVAKKEVQRLANLGYVVAMETCSDGNETETYFTLHATADQVKNFAADAKVGYALWLYDERVEANENVTGTVNVWHGGVNAATDEVPDGGRK